MNDFRGVSASEKLPNAGQLAVVYALLLVAAVLIFFVIRYFGENLPAQPLVTTAPVTAPRSIPQSHLLSQVLIALVTIISAARIFGFLCQRVGQPRVIGEVIAGIALGPSLLGQFAPDAMVFVFPSTITPVLGILAQLGVILYMFLIGL